MLYVSICDETSKVKAEIKGENVRLISTSYDPTVALDPLISALTGGAQPNHGWWAPVACAYKEVGGRLALGTRLTVLPHPPPTSPTDLGLAQCRREASPPPLYPPPHSHSPHYHRALSIMSGSSISTLQGGEGSFPSPLSVCLSLSHAKVKP